jgi:NACalpha-BTF3-like transcription factor
MFFDLFTLPEKLYLGGIPDDEKHLPSPDDLKGYVIVKVCALHSIQSNIIVVPCPQNKKLKAGVDETEEGDDEFSDEEITEADIEYVAREAENSEEKEKKASAIKGLLDSVKGIQRTPSKKKSKVCKPH